MIKRIISAILCAAMLCLLCSCGIIEAGKRTDNSIPEEIKAAADPLVTLVNAINNNKAEDYIKAFPADVKEKLGDSAVTSLQTSLDSNREVDVINYGTGEYLRFDVISEEATDISKLGSGSNDYINDYQLDTSKVSEAKKVTVDVMMLSTNSSKTSALRLFIYLVKIDDAWFVHPTHFGTMLK